METIKSASDFVKINISNSKNDNIGFERKFDKSLKIAELKSKLEIITGGNAATMEIELYNGNKLITKLSDDNAMIGSYPIEEGMRLHVIDNFLYIGENVEKFELTEDQYKQKQNTVRDYLLRNKLGKYNEEEMKALEEKRKADDAEAERLAESIVIGARCMVTAKGPHRIGTIMYKGPLDGKPGIFIGVKFDEPLGVNDGSVNGKRYFDCAPKYGSMVPISAVTVGDYPVETLDIDEEI